MSHATRRPSLHVRDLKARLEAVGCPFMGGVEEAWVNELVLEVGESRDRIVKWLVEEVLGAPIEKADIGAGKTGDSKGLIGRLTYVCACLGLCDAGDHELVSGAQKNQTQAVFFSRLLSMVGILKGGACAELVEQGQELVSGLTQEELREITGKGEIDLIPADIRKYIELDSLEETEGKPVGPGTVKLAGLLAELGREAENIQTEIERQILEIGALGTSECEKTEFSDLTRGRDFEYTTKIKSISVSLQNLKYLLASFTDFYSSEVEPGLRTRRFPSPQTELGLEIAQAHSALRENLELIERAKELSLSAKHISALNESKQQYGKLGMLAANIVKTLDIHNESELIL